jgi:metal-responsive CopG/Arc/MetJ family transcriptional regulator
MSRLTVRIPDELQTDLGALARTAGKSESEIVRAALTEYLDRHGNSPSCYELAKVLGLIGCVQSGAGDLSTNPAHMEGFGRE